MVIDVSRVMVVQVMGDRIFDTDGCVSASYSGERVSRRQCAPLLPAAVRGTHDPCQGRLGPDRAQIERRSSRKRWGDFKFHYRLRVVVCVDGRIVSAD